ncbi:MAG: MotA/TolQ/ExbB proton channel family protein [Oleiphilaceae bacterium]|nr:MotA/TolQ/ExbB proton channel family protein [Oleiphilaceae bacterium]
MESSQQAGLLAPLQELLAMGGPAMAVLLSLSVIGLAAALYTFILMVVAAPRPTRPIEQAVVQWCHGEGVQARRQLEAQRNPLAGLLSFAMACRQQGKSAGMLREELARRAQRLVAPFESPLKLIEVIAALAPLLGLLGTVMGMMTAFSTMAGSEGQANPSELSGGIYEALSTTAAGLIIAIPFAALAAWLEFRLRRTQQHINDYLVRIFQSPDTLRARDSGDSREGFADSASESPARDSAQNHAMA